MSAFIPTGLFVAVQAAFWVLVIRSWLRLRSAPNNSAMVRHWIAIASLGCGSVTLVLTAAMTLYARVWQQAAYDPVERRFLFFTMIASVLGVVLALVGKDRPRLIGLLTSAFTLVIAVFDALAF